MARNFVRSSSQYLEYAGGIITGPAATMCAWIKQASNTGTQQIVSFNTSGANTHRMGIGIDTANAPFAFSHDGVSVTTSSTAPTTLSVGTWGLVTGVFASTTSRLCYLNATAGTTDTTSKTLSGVNRSTIGRNSSVTTNYFDGDIAEVGMWNVALTAADVGQLAAGYCPLFVRPDALVGYVPLIGNSSPAMELIEGRGFTLNNSPATANHVRIIRPRPSRAQFWGRSAAPPATVRRGIRRGMAHRVVRMHD